MRFSEVIPEKGTATSSFLSLSGAPHVPKGQAGWECSLSPQLQEPLLCRVPSTLFSCSCSSGSLVLCCRVSGHTMPSLARWPAAGQGLTESTKLFPSLAVFLPYWKLSGREMQLRRNQYSQTEKNLLHLQQINLAQIYRAPGVSGSLSLGRNQS